MCWCEVCAGGLRARPRCVVVGGRGVRGGFVVRRGRERGGLVMGSLCVVW